MAEAAKKAATKKAATKDEDKPEAPVSDDSRPVQTYRDEPLEPRVGTHTREYDPE